MGLIYGSTVRTPRMNVVRDLIDSKDDWRCDWGRFGRVARDWHVGAVRRYGCAGNHHAAQSGKHGVG
jgi:hypothetical protein